MTGLRILTATERLAEPRGAKIAILGRPGVGKTYSPAHPELTDARRDFVSRRRSRRSLCRSTWRSPASARKRGPTFATRPVHWAGRIRRSPPARPTARLTIKKVMANAGSRRPCGLPDAVRRLPERSVAALPHLGVSSSRKASRERGRKDLRGTYGLVAREMIAWLQQLQHMRSRTVIFIAVLEKSRRRLWRRDLATADRRSADRRRPAGDRRRSSHSWSGSTSATASRCAPSCAQSQTPGIFRRRIDPESSSKSSRRISERSWPNSASHRSTEGEAP